MRACETARNSRTPGRGWLRAMVSMHCKRRRGRFNMKRSYSILGALLSWVLVLGKATSAAPQASLAEVELLTQPRRSELAGLPSSVPRPVLYFLDRANVPSCGLLPSTPGALMITPILETDIPLLPGGNRGSNLRVPRRHRICLQVSPTRYQRRQQYD